MDSYQIDLTGSAGAENEECSTDMGDGLDNCASTDMSGDTEADAESQIQEIAESLRQVEELQPEAWQQLDGTQRLEMLQGLENRIAEIQGRPPVPVRAEPMAPGVYGGYVRGQGITLSYEHVASNDVRELVDSMAHEGRHAYQDHAIRTPGFVSDTNLVDSWRSNWGNYLTAEEYGQELYQSQPIERDAWQYASRIAEALFGAKR